MKTIKHPIAFSPAYPLERIAPREDLLFFDIETTGFSGASSQLYLIGCVYFDGFGWRLIQWFADTRGCEAQLLDAFFSFMKDFRVLVHFNGDGFDIPYLLKCCSRLGLSHSFDGIESLDIYKKIKPLRSFLGLESMKQKAVEAFLGVSREDVYTGGELIDVYRRYLYTGDEDLLRLLLLHNEDDLKGMPAILPILHYPDALSSPFLLRESCLLPREGGAPCLRLLWESPVTVPIPLEKERSPVNLELAENSLSCLISLRQGELKYFYPNYEDYYYLPLEDQAVHKSVGEYVDRSARKKATARTCYTRSCGLFLPQFSPLWKPALKEDYSAPLSYTPYKEELFSKPEISAAYARQLLDFVRETGKRREKTGEPA